MYTPDNSIMSEVNPIPVTIGITAYNEAANIGALLDRILTQALDRVVIERILVVSSGSTDATNAIVTEYTQRDPRIELLIEATRAGKASALNWIIHSAETPHIIICSADLQPDTHAVERLVAPLALPDVGMTGCRPVPVNDPNTFMGFAVHMQWNLHHYIALEETKAGEMIAFRRIFERIPVTTAVDEASIEPLIRGQGYSVRYVPDAIVYNKGPETISDFLRQRRRIYAGHLAMTEQLGYSVSTMSGTRILRLLLKHIDRRPKQFVWTWAVVILEAYGRWLGKRDHKNKHDHAIWEIAGTTKQLSN
ncbi:MAG TPA: glycosyltransferase [Anaerolineae bacterium]|nr:glycosyltransferase [Anaerolineae bacterium]